MKFIFGVLLGIILTIGAGLSYFWFGFAPVAVADHPMPFERTIANKAVDAHIARQPQVDSPLVVNEANLVSGAYLYGMNCSGCHGLPGKPNSPMQTAMYPPPPQFFASGHAHNHEIGEVHWDVVNGIRLTGMPSFQGMMSETDMWQVSQVLANASSLPDAAKSALASAGSEPSKLN